MDHLDTTTPAETSRPAQPFEAPDFDDGLVHDHGWACSDRGTQAH